MNANEAQELRYQTLVQQNQICEILDIIYSNIKNTAVQGGSSYNFTNSYFSAYKSFQKIDNGYLMDFIKQSLEKNGYECEFRAFQGMGKFTYDLSIKW